MKTWGLIHHLLVAWTGHTNLLHQASVSLTCNEDITIPAQPTLLPMGYFITRREKKVSSGWKNSQKSTLPLLAPCTTLHPPQGLILRNSWESVGRVRHPWGLVQTSLPCRGLPDPPEQTLLQNPPWASAQFSLSNTYFFRKCLCSVPVVLDQRSARSRSSLDLSWSVAVRPDFSTQSSTQKVLVE